MVGLSTMFIVYDETKGFRLFKYMDTHCILALVIVSIVASVFGENFTGILIFYALINIGGLFLLKFWNF